MRSLHHVHEMHAKRSVRMIQLNRWAEFDEVWYGGCAIWIYRKIFNFQQSVIPIFRTNELARWD
jgi:hypothetical protein